MYDPNYFHREVKWAGIYHDKIITETEEKERVIEIRSEDLMLLHMHSDWGANYEGRKCFKMGLTFDSCNPGQKWVRSQIRMLGFSSLFLSCGR